MEPLTVGDFVYQLPSLIEMIAGIGMLCLGLTIMSNLVGTRSSATQSETRSRIERSGIGTGLIGASIPWLMMFDPELQARSRCIAQFDNQGVLGLVAEGTTIILSAWVFCCICVVSRAIAANVSVQVVDNDEMRARPSNPATNWFLGLALFVVIIPVVIAQSKFDAQCAF